MNDLEDDEDSLDDIFADNRGEECDGVAAKDCRGKKKSKKNDYAADSTFISLGGEDSKIYDNSKNSQPFNHTFGDVSMYDEVV